MKIYANIKTYETNLNELLTQISLIKMSLPLDLVQLSAGKIL